MSANTEFKYRHDPPPFLLDSPLYQRVMDYENMETKLYLFGLGILFTPDKKKKLMKNSSFQPVSFRAMLNSFLSWVSTLTSEELQSGLDRYDSHKRSMSDGLYHAPGGYDNTGNFVEVRDDPKMPLAWIVDSRRFAQQFSFSGVGGSTKSSRGSESSAAAAAASAKAVGTEKPIDEEEETAFARSTKAAAGAAAAMAAHAAAVDSSSSGFSRSAAAGGFAAAAARKSTGGFDADRDRGGSAGEEAKSTGGAGGEKKEKSGTGDSAAMTEEQARKTAAAARELERNLPNKYQIGRWDLTARRRPKWHTEIHVPVARGNYGGVLSKIVFGPQGGFVITGRTGCGKSTVALLGLFRNPASTVLVVEPTQANAANIYHEFVNILPNMVEAGIIEGNVPEARFVAPTVSKPPFPPLLITTTEQLLQYFYAEGKLPAVDYLVLDEFHLPVPSMVETVELLRTFNLVGKYILVSATARGFSVNIELPAAVTHTYGNLAVGKIPRPLERSDLDPRRWRQVGDGTFCVIAPSIALARRLASEYREWGLRVYLITRHTLVSYYMRAATDYKPYTVFVLEPGVEAGVTLGMAVMASMGASTAIHFDGRVVTEDMRPLNQVDGIQRGGRAGRVKPTLYITPRAPDSTDESSTADYFRAQAVIKMVAMGARIEEMNVESLLEVFPKLSTLNQVLASRAVRTQGDPFLAVYKTSPDGHVFKECGGSGEGFSELAKKELFLYYYPRGYFVAPIADFSDLSSVPDKFVIRQKQFDAAVAIVDAVHGLKERYSLENLVAMVIGKFDVYVGDFFDRMRGVFSLSSAEPYTLRTESPPEIADFLKAAPAVVKLFDYMKTQPLGVKYLRVVSHRSGHAFCEHSFQLGDKYIHFNIPGEYMKDSHVDVNKLSDAVKRLLQGLLSIEILQLGAPSRCVNLEDYKDKVAEEHAWFKANVL